MTRPPPNDYPADSEAATKVYAAPRLNLCGTVGPLRGRVYTSDGNTVLIGRGEQCTIVLLVAGISRQHARIDYRGGHYWISDLGTLNGTWVNGKLLESPAQLEEGDRILICNQEFMARYGEIDRDELLRRREGSIVRPMPLLHTPRGTALPTATPDAGTVKVKMPEMPVAEPSPVGRPGSQPPAAQPGSKPPAARPGSQPPRPGSQPPRPSSQPPRPGSQPPRPGSQPPRPGSQPPISRTAPTQPPKPPTSPPASRPGTFPPTSRPITQPPIHTGPVSPTGSRPGTLPPALHPPPPLPPAPRLPTPPPRNSTQPGLMVRRTPASPLGAVRFTQRTHRIELSPLARRVVLVAGVAVGVIILSVTASIIAVHFVAPAQWQTKLALPPPPPPAPIVTPVVPQQPLPATLEAEGIVHLTASDDGIVRRCIPEGSAVRAGTPLVETGVASPDTERKRARLAELEAKYGKSPDYADLIAQARDEYEKAVRRQGRSVLTAPRSGIVTRQRVRAGDTIARGDDVCELASRVRLFVATGSVEGNAAACKATLLDRGDATIIGHMLPFPPDARVRTLIVDRLPPGLPLGSVGKVRVTCQ